MSYRIPSVAVLAALLGAVPAGRADPAAGLPGLVGASERFQHDGPTGLALAGFDPVSYHLPGGPRAGRAEHQLVWAGAAWRFAGAANRAAFAADPVSFAPQVGGYDAEAASRGRLVDADPTIFVVREGRLYVFRTEAARAGFLADPTLAARSHEGWRVLREGLVGP
jgi:hypothetical protein